MRNILSAIVTGVLTLFVGAFLMVSVSEIAWADEGQNVYRLWQPRTGEHLLTTNWGEVSSLEANTPWIYEGTAFDASLEGLDVYRLYNPWSGEHFYTASSIEKNSLVASGWNDEGAIFKTSDVETTYPVYRLFNPYETGPGPHLWTTDKTEYESLASSGWGAEGIAFYAIGAGIGVPEDQRKKPTTPEDDFAAEWAPRIDAYNAGWPLAGYGDAFARAAYRTGMDPRCAPAIARIESGSGKQPLYRYGAGNCWGWMAPLTNDFESSIYLYCEKFSRSYGSTLTWNNVTRYAGYLGYMSVFNREMSKI